MIDSLLKLAAPNRPFLPSASYAIAAPRVRHIWLTATVHRLRAAPGPIKVLEIGSWMGSSAITLAEAIDRFVPARGTILCIDQWIRYASAADLSDGRPAHRAFDDALAGELPYEIFRHNVGSLPIAVHHMRGPSATMLGYLAPASFDLVFVDGSHYFADIDRDLELALPLVRDGGYICGDDLELQAAEIDQAVARASGDRDVITDARTGRRYHPGVSLAVGARLGAVSSYDGYWVMQRSGGGFRPVDLFDERALVPSYFGPEDLALVVSDARGTVSPLARFRGEIIGLPR
jgi:predicted O-methyltransferase YrrM